MKVTSALDATDWPATRFGPFNRGKAITDNPCIGGCGGRRVGLQATVVKITASSGSRTPARRD